jgi:hypothetical protein
MLSTILQENLKYKGYLESNFWSAVNKTVGGKKYYIKKYILKLLINVVTAKIEALFVLRNKFLCAFVKEVCHL